MARPEAHGGPAPRGLRLATDGGTALTASMGVIHWIHHRATHMGAAPQIARATRFADGDVLVVEIAYLVNGGQAGKMYQALLARGQAHLGVITLFRHQLSRPARAADDLAAAARVQLD